MATADVQRPQARCPLLRTTRGWRSCRRRCATEGRLILAEPDEDKRADLVEALAERHAVAALDFLLAVLDTDPSADVRENIVDELEEVATPGWTRRSSAAC